MPTSSIRRRCWSPVSNSLTVAQISAVPVPDSEKSQLASVKMEIATQEKQTSLPMSRRKFVLAASSAWSFVNAGALNCFAKLGGGSSVPFPSGAAASQSQAGGQTKPKVLVFDVNETLPDLNALRPQFARVFGDGKALDVWFELLLHYSLVVTVADAYADFGTVGRAVLEMLASTRGIKLSTDDATKILQGVLTMPVHPDVPAALQRLRAAGFRMVTLTNSSPSAVRAQLQNAGLTQYFDESISVDSVRRFKPDLEVYRSAAAHLGAQPRELLLIAAHPWDVFGAMKAGWQAAFVARNGITPLPLGPKPTINGPELKAIADAILN
jgi:2-haloacid dehalogenase